MQRRTLIWAVGVLLAVALLTKVVDSVVVSAAEKNPPVIAKVENDSEAPIGGGDTCFRDPATGLDSTIVLQAATSNADSDSLYKQAWIEQQQSSSLSTESLVSSDSVTTTDAGLRALATDVD
jgi:Tfp pilus assembly protein PilW